MRIPTCFAACAALVTLAVSPARADTELTLLTYTGLFQDRYTSAVIEPFMKANPDIKVSYYAQPTSAQMLGILRAQKAAPQVDVVLFDVSVSKAGTDEGLFEKLDEASAPNIADLYPNARIPNVAGVGVTFDNLVLLYNTEAVKTAPTSWMALVSVVLVSLTLLVVLFVERTIGLARTFVK